MARKGWVRTEYGGSDGSDDSDDNDNEEEKEEDDRLMLSEYARARAANRAMRAQNSSGGMVETYGWVRYREEGVRKSDWFVHGDEA